MDITVGRIEQAIEDNEFYVEYLPIMCLKTGSCIGAEALIRWRIDNQQISPELFIPIAENTPLSGIITYWLIGQIAIEVLDWLKATPDVYISFNIPPEIIGRGGIWYALKKAGLLEVKDKMVGEITERGVPDQQAINAIVENNKKGFKICLDDVGASPENLVLYSRLNIDIIKLDKSYADEMLKPNWTSDRIEPLRALTQSTGIKIVAEGIETKKQSDIFQSAGIKLGQGWFFSKSLLVAEFLEFYRAKIVSEI